MAKASRNLGSKYTTERLVLISGCQTRDEDGRFKTPLRDDHPLLHNHDRFRAVMGCQTDSSYPEVL